SHSTNCVIQTSTVRSLASVRDDVRRVTLSVVERSLHLGRTKVNQTHLLQPAGRGEPVALIRGCCAYSKPSLCKFPERCPRSSGPRSCRRGLCCQRRLRKPRRRRTSVPPQAGIRRTRRPCVLCFSDPTARSRFFPQLRRHPTALRVRCRSIR